MIQLSRHFTLDEFTRSATAERLRIDNSPPSNALDNLIQLAKIAEQVRTLLGNVPLIISSGYRCAELNKAVGGAMHSAHQAGLALDFTAPRYGTPFAISEKIASAALTFDQLILERQGAATWVHLGIAAKGKTPRRELLTIDHQGTRAGLWE